jgi:alkylhydroperoxidase family enzyme
MSRFPIHTARTAPSRGARAALREVLRQRGHVPNLHGVLALSEPVLRAYMELGAQINRATLTVLERQVVMLQANQFRKAPYCMAGHSAIAHALGMPDSWLQSLRDGQPVPDTRCEALRQFTLAVLRDNGAVSDDQWRAFQSAGYEPAQGLEVVMALALKTLSNFASRLSEVPLDPAYAPMAWNSQGVAHELD